MPQEVTATQRSTEARSKAAQRPEAGHRTAGSARPPGPATASASDGMPDGWSGFSPGRWQQTIDVRDFIQRNVTPYEGDEAFLSGPSERTKAVWDKLQPYCKEEIRKGVLDVDVATPSS